MTKEEIKNLKAEWKKARLELTGKLNILKAEYNSVKNELVGAKSLLKESSALYNDKLKKLKIQQLDAEKAKLVGTV